MRNRRTREKYDMEFFKEGAGKKNRPGRLVKIRKKKINFTRWIYVGGGSKKGSR